MNDNNSIPTEYLELTSYFDSNGTLNKKFLLNYARGMADSLGQARLKAGQLRRFFDEARRLERRIRLVRKDGAGNEESILTEVYKLVALAEYAVNRRVAPLVFSEFITKNVEDLIKTPDDFLRGFMPHFECIVGFANLPKD